MKAIRDAIVAIFGASLAFVLIPEIVHPYSWTTGLVEAATLLIFLGPAAGCFWGIQWCRIMLGVVTSITAVLWTALPFVPVDYDRDRSDLLTWGYFEALLIVTAIMVWNVPGRCFDKNVRQATEPPTPNDRAAS